MFRQNRRRRCEKKGGSDEWRDKDGERIDKHPLEGEKETAGCGEATGDEDGQSSKRKSEFWTRRNRQGRRDSGRT